MSFGSSPFKRGREEDVVSNKRARTAFVEINHTQTMEMPQAFQAQFAAMSAQQQMQMQAHAQQQQQQQQHQTTYGMEMDMVDDSMLEDDEDEDEESPACGAALAARLGGYNETASNPTHSWNQNAPRMSHQHSTSSLSSVSSSAAPGTPLDFPDQYCSFATPTPSNPNSLYPSQSNPTAFVDMNGQTRQFPSSAPAMSSSLSVYPPAVPTSEMDEATAFASYAEQHGYQQKTSPGSIHIAQPGLNQISCDGSVPFATHAAWLRHKSESMRRAEAQWLWSSSASP